MDIKSLRKTKNTIIISTEESLKDIVPIEWSEEVINGDKQITVNNKEDE